MNRPLWVSLTVMILAMAFGVAGCRSKELDPMVQPTKTFEHRMLGDEPYLVYCQENPQNLVLVFHTWADNYTQAAGWFRDLKKLQNACVVAPNYNGANNNPKACGSKDAMARIKTVVQAFRQAHPFRSVSIIGASGGGYTGFMALGSFPELIDYASIWIPIYDLAAWYEEVGELEPAHQQDLIGCFGHPPEGPDDPQYLSRSPRNVLDGVAGPKRIVINAGKYDGLKEYNGSVPTYHGRKGAEHIQAACPECEVTYIEFDGAHEFHADIAVEQINDFLAKGVKNR